MKQYRRIEPTDTHVVGGKFKRQVVVKRFQTDDGMTHEFTTLHQEGQRSAAVVALTPDNQVVISRQFRPGRERYLDELPGGAVEPGEDPEAAARRELLEEAGYVPGTMTFLGTYAWDAYSNITGYYYLATDCVPAVTRTVEQIEVDQGLETVMISIQALIDNARHDQMTDIAGVLLAYDELLRRKK